MTRHFPQPGERRKEIEIEHEGIVEKRISECERRQNDISKVDPNHPLLLIAFDCLKDKDFERPSAKELCKSMAMLQKGHEYSESLRTVRDKSTPEQGNSTQSNESQRQQHAKQIEDLQWIIRSQVIYLEEKDQSITQKDEIIEAKVQEIQQLTQQRREEIQQYKGKIQQQRKEIQQLRQYREDTQQKERKNERIIKEQKRQLASVQAGAEGQLSELVGELNLSQRSQSHPKLRSRDESRGNIELRWREGKKAPCKISSDYNITVDGNTAYLRDGINIYAYTLSTCTWSQLPDYMFVDCPSVIVNNLLTLVGGRVAYGKLTNQLFSLRQEGRDRRWTIKEVFPPMPTKRYGSSALCTGTALIVAGGVGESQDMPVATVEVMSTKTHEWSTAVDLPEPTLFGALVQVDDCCMYVGNGNSVYTCSVSALLQFCKLRSLGARRPRAQSSPNIIKVWSKVTDLPVTCSTCISLHGQLLVVGGKDSYFKPTSALHMYSPATNSWQVISHMATPRYSCFAAVLPDNQLMVVGGETDSGKTDTVEIAKMIH